MVTSEGKEADADAMRTAFLSDRDAHAPFGYRLNDGVALLPGTLDAGKRGIIIEGFCAYSERGTSLEQYQVQLNDGAVVRLD